MEVFSQKLEDDLSSHPFLDDRSNPSSFNAVETTAEGTLVHTTVPLERLVDWVNDDGNTGSHHTVKILEIKIQWVDRWIPDISKTLYDAVCRAFGINAWYKLFMYRRYRGFFHSQHAGDKDITTFAVGTAWGSVGWSYSAAPGSTCTKAICLLRGSLLRERCVSYGNYTGHPLFPGFVHAMLGVETSLMAIDGHDRALRKVEQATGYLSNSVSFGLPKVSRKGLGELSKDVADVSNSLAVEWSIINTAKQVLDLLTDGSSRFREARATSWDTLSEVACYLLKDISRQEQYNGQLLKRVENQMTIILHLITREDTAATIRLAEATKRDSSSMKTLAVMTMVFLPATFYASVFAMPSLSVDQPPDFKVYLALAIPTTVAILLAWAAITQRQIIRNSILDVVPGLKRARDREESPLEIEMASVDS